MGETSDLTRPLIDALNQTGGLAMRMNSGRVKVRGGWVRLHSAGTADILFFPRLTSIFSGVHTPVWIETKQPKGRTNPEQIQAQEQFRDYVVEVLGHRYIRATTIAEGLEALHLPENANGHP